MRLLTTLLCAAAIAALSLLPATAGARPMYTNLYNDGKLTSLLIDANGIPSLAPGSPVDAGGYPQTFSVSPDGRFAAVNYPFMTENFMRSVALDGAGGVGTPGAPVAGANDWATIFSPDGRHVYSASDAGGVNIYTFSDGTITPAGAAGSGPVRDLAITPDGRFLYGADYDNARVHRFAVAQDGSLTPLPQLDIAVAGAKSAKITPDGRFLIIVTDGVMPAPSGFAMSFAIGPDGSLSPTGSQVATVSTSIGDRTALSPDGTAIYVANRNDYSISKFAIDGNGVLTKVSDAPVPLVILGSLAITGDGRYLIAEDQISSAVRTFSTAGGVLTPVGGPVSTGGSGDGSSPQTHPLQPPKAALKTTVKGPGEKSSFDATGSADVDGGSVVSYRWSFGDGTVATTASPKTTHRYKKAGVFDASVAPVDDEGCFADGIFDGQITLCNRRADARASKSLDTPPAISRLKLSKKRFMAGKKVKVKFRLSEKSRVTLTVKKGRKRVGSFRVNGRRGSNSVKFTGILKRRALAPGSYKLELIARDRKGKSTPKSARFKIS